MIELDSTDSAIAERTPVDLQELLAGYIGRTLRFERASVDDFDLPFNGRTLRRRGLVRAERLGILEHLELSSYNPKGGPVDEFSQLTYTLRSQESVLVKSNRPFERRIRLFQEDKGSWIVIHQSPGWEALIEKEAGS